MPLYRFLHTADLHLDAPFKGLAAARPELAERLRGASLDALRRLVDLAIARSCSFVAVSGDVYDGLARGVRAQLHLREAAERLDAAGARLLVLHGNHDPIDEGYRAVRAWPDSTHFFAKSEAQTIAFESDGGRVTVTGRSYPAKKVRENLAARYPRPEGPGLHVAMLHSQVGEGPPHDYSPCTVTELERRGFHYWALGHVHDRQVLRENPTIAYPGNLQGRHFGECGPRGALVVEGSADGLRTEFVPLSRLEFRRARVDATGLETVDDLAPAVLEAVEASDAERLARAEIIGRSKLFRQLSDAGQRDELRRALEDQSPAGLTWVEVRSELRPDLDLDRLAGAPTLAGALLTRARGWTEEAKRTVLAEVRGLGPFAGALEADALDALAQRALDRALDAVHPGETP